MKQYALRPFFAALSQHNLAAGDNAWVNEWPGLRAAFGVKLDQSFRRECRFHVINDTVYLRIVNTVYPLSVL